MVRRFHARAEARCICYRRLFTPGSQIRAPEESATEMKAKFEGYSLELQEVLIGTPRAAAGDQTIENILIQLRSRQIAREQVETYQEQKGRHPGAHAQ
jgi:uncharacterized membrane protein YqiK